MFVVSYVAALVGLARSIPHLSYLFVCCVHPAPQPLGSWQEVGLKGVPLKAQ